MNNPRKYGRPPYKLAVLHGGPGALGDVAQLAHELGKICGTLEPFQTQLTIYGLVDELREIIQKNTTPPITLIEELSFTHITLLKRSTYWPAS